MHACDQAILFPICLFPLHNLLWTSIYGSAIICPHPYLWLYRIPLFGFNQFTGMDIHDSCSFQFVAIIIGTIVDTCP